MSWKVAMPILKGSWKYYGSCCSVSGQQDLSGAFKSSLFWVAAHTGEQTGVPATTSLDETGVSPYHTHGWNRSTPRDSLLEIRVPPTIPLDETGTPLPLPWMKQGYPHYPFGGNGGIPNPLLNERWVSTCIWCCVHQCKTTWDLHCRDFLPCVLGLVC